MDKVGKASIGFFVLSVISTSAFAYVPPQVVGALPMVTFDQINAAKNGNLASPPPSVNLAVVPSNSAAPFTPAPVTFRNNLNNVDVAPITVKNNVQHTQDNKALVNNSHPENIQTKIQNNSCGDNAGVKNLISLNKSDTDTTVDAHPTQVQLSTGNVSGLDLHGDQLIHFAKEIDNQDNSHNSATSSTASDNNSDHAHVTVTSQVVHEVLDNMVSMVGAVESEAAAINQGGQVVLGAIQAATKTDETTPTVSPPTNTANSIPSTHSAISISTPSENINHAVETVITSTSNTENNSVNNAANNNAVINNSSVNTALISTPVINTTPVITTQNNNSVTLSTPVINTTPVIHAPAVNLPTVTTPVINTPAVNTSDVNTRTTITAPSPAQPSPNNSAVIETGGVTLTNTGLEHTGDTSVVVGQIVQASGTVAEVDTSGSSHELSVGDNVHLGGKFVFTGGTGNLVIKSFTGELQNVVA